MNSDIKKQTTIFEKAHVSDHDLPNNDNLKKHGTQKRRWVKNEQAGVFEDDDDYLVERQRSGNIEIVQL